MKTPLPISLRTNEGKILKEYTVDPLNYSFQYALTVENDWAFPYALNVYNEITGSVCASIPVMVNDPDRRGIRRVETTEKKIALGFDCGYNNVYTDYILDTLDEYDAKAMNDEDFRGIYGIGEFKSQKYAAAFIAAVSEFGSK